MSVSAPSDVIGQDYVARLAQKVDLRAQLADTQQNLSVGKTAVALLGGTSQVGGAWASLEAEHRLTNWLALTAQGGWSAKDGWNATAGAKAFF